MAFLDLVLGAGVAFAATSLGSLGILFVRGKVIGKDGYSIILSFCAGVMAFSAVEMLGKSHVASGDLNALGGVALGVFLLFLIEKTLPHAHVGVKLSDERKKTALIAGTISLHNIPEGFAIASAFAASTPLGWLVTTSIAFQDIPEGLLVSTPLVCYGLEKRRCVNFGILSGIVEFAASIIGYLFLSEIAKAIPFALAFSAGAMIYVVVEELIPDALKNGPQRTIALSFIGGSASAFVLATILGF